MTGSQSFLFYYFEDICGADCVAQEDFVKFINFARKFYKGKFEKKKQVKAPQDGKTCNNCLNQGTRMCCHCFRDVYREQDHWHPIPEGFVLSEK